MHGYSLYVALFDFLPVLVAAAGLALLARAIAHTHHRLAPVAWGAAVLIPLGGLSRAGWKLGLALQSERFTWLEDLLFPLMAPGFVAMAFSLFHARRAWQAGASPHKASARYVRLLLWLSVPLAIGLGAALRYPDTRLWFFWLLAVATLANVALLVQAILASRWSGLSWAVVACFIYNFAAALALSGLSRLPAGETSAWIQEGVNLSAQVALALGLWRLSGRMQQNS